MVEILRLGGRHGVSKDIKVTDKRMFTPEGELRDEFQHLQRGEASGAEAEKEGERDRRSEAPPEPRTLPRREGGESSADVRGDPGPRPDAQSPPLEIPGTPEGMGKPTFLDLLALVAEPVPIYLGDVALPDGRSAENLEAARLHIDLLDVLEEKTAGNLTAREAAMLEDLLYRLRMRYVDKRG